MGFQTTVNYDFGFGVAGEIRNDGPIRVNSGLILSGSAANNIVGATAFTQANTGGTFAAGGTGIFKGILCNPKVYASFGTSAGVPLAPTMTLANNVQAEFMIMGYLIVAVGAAANIGDIFQFSQATGALSTLAPGSSATAGNTLIPGMTVDKFPQTNSGGGLVLARLT